MKTYCKLGDRAIIIGGTCGNEGKVVRIIDDIGSHAQGSKVEYRGVIYKCNASGQKWGIESEGSPLNCTTGVTRAIRLHEDCTMRPLPKITEPVMELESAE